MLTLIALSALLIQDPPPRPRSLETGARFVMVGGDGAGRLDADGDGLVTREEFSAPINAAFARLDKDGDGRLSAQEQTFNGPGGEAETVVIQQSDGRGMRSLSFRPHGSDREEGPFVIREGRCTATIAGGDGPGPDQTIIVRSVGRGEPHVVELDGCDAPGRGRVALRRFGGPEGSGGEALDKDGDGKVSEAEFTAPLREAFARADADRSGFIEDGERAGDGQVQVFTHRIERRDRAE